MVVSGLSDVYWVCCASDGSSDSDPEPPWKVRPSRPDPPLEDGPTDVPAHAEVCATEPSPAQEIGKDGTVWTVMEPCGGTGRWQIQNILTESAGPTQHARHNITDKLTAFMCLCDSCKARRNVTILSTQHQHVAISTERKKKPEAVDYYNHSKVGVDVLDQMARQYSVKGGTRRWPVAVFYNVLDLAAINAWVLYQSCMSQNIPRRDFVLQQSGWHQKRHHLRTCPSPEQKSAGE
ncbi:hypothetical protein F7725_014526 [Dissostichus mawsoni]|uniref:PiggyBac transposable element-derived protein domain-containing protein n=1 Tax=Dissostichus mawsoni TaxID=36200 RepID=A0A7J5Z0I4_DISMA|nr:hypothetical protein F7725_014526 [Dissostichus mawsoni]